MRRTRTRAPRGCADRQNIFKVAAFSEFRALAGVMTRQLKTLCPRHRTNPARLAQKRRRAMSDRPRRNRDLPTCIIARCDAVFLLASSTYSAPYWPGRKRMAPLIRGEEK